MMMNQWKYLLGLLFLFLLACNRAGEHEALFRQVESVVSDHPDSAMVLLETIQNPERLPERDWAYWALLTTQAKDKLYIRHTSDSVINRVVDYFDGFSFFRYRHEKALAYYYKGRVNNDLGHLEEALKAYHKAYDNAKWTDDYKLTYLIESQIGKIYIYQDMHHLAYDAFKIAADAAQLAKDSTSIAYSSIYLARVSGERGDWKQAKSFYRHAIDIANQINNIQVSFYGTKELAAVYTEEDSLDVALELTKYAFAAESKYDIPHDWSLDLTIGDIYRKMHQIDSADYYLNRAVKSNNIYTQSSAYKALYSLYEEINPEIAVKYNALYEASVNSIEAMGTSSDSFQIYKERNTEKWEGERALGFVLISIISLSLVYMFYYSLKNKWKSRKELEKSQSEKQQISERLNKVYNQLLESESQCERIGKEKESIEKKKKESDKRILYLEGNLKSYDEKIFQISRGEEIVLDLKKNPYALPHKADRDCVLAFVDVTDMNFVVRLKYRFPEMKRADIEYAAFVRLGFGLHDLKVILGIDIRSVSRRKNNVKNCVVSELPKHMDVDDFLKKF